MCKIKKIKKRHRNLISKIKRMIKINLFKIKHKE